MLAVPRTDVLDVVGGALGAVTSLWSLEGTLYLWGGGIRLLWLLRFLAAAAGATLSRGRLRYVGLLIGQAW